MSISFSPSDLGFYDSEYEYGENLPDDLIEITDEIHQAFLESPPDGKKLGSVNNLPAWVDDIPTRTELEAKERAWAQSELRRTDFIILPDSAYKDDERDKVKTYRAALRNPSRSTRGTFPQPSWRPEWPERVKEPD